MYEAGQHLSSIGVLYTMCTHSQQHEVLTRAEWILASTGNNGQIFNRYGVGVSLYSPPAICTARPACYWTQPSNTSRWTSAGLMLGQRHRRWTSIGPTFGQRLVFARSVDKPHFVSHISVVPKRNNKFCLIQNLRPVMVVNDSCCNLRWHFSVKILKMLPNWLSLKTI